MELVQGGNSDFVGTAALGAHTHQSDPPGFSDKQIQIIGVLIGYDLNTEK
jgi:hypothetical protein